VYTLRFEVWSLKSKLAGVCQRNSQVILNRRSPRTFHQICYACYGSVTALLRLRPQDHPMFSRVVTVLRLQCTTYPPPRPLQLTGQWHTLKNSNAFLRFKVLQGFSRVLKPKNPLPLNHGKYRPDQNMYSFWTVLLGNRAIRSIRTHSELNRSSNDRAVQSVPGRIRFQAAARHANDHALGAVIGGCKVPLRENRDE
jgi:hypothetical protein